MQLKRRILQKVWLHIQYIHTLKKGSESRREISMILPKNYWKDKLVYKKDELKKELMKIQREVLFRISNSAIIALCTDKCPNFWKKWGGGGEGMREKLFLLGAAKLLTHLCPLGFSYLWSPPDTSKYHQYLHIFLPFYADSWSRNVKICVSGS